MIPDEQLIEGRLVSFKHKGRVMMGIVTKVQRRTVSVKMKHRGRDGSNFSNVPKKDLLDVLT